LAGFVSGALKTIGSLVASGVKTGVMAGCGGLRSEVENNGDELAIGRLAERKGLLPRMSICIGSKCLHDGGCTGATLRFLNEFSLAMKGSSLDPVGRLAGLGL
jgi:hypothetical protein